MSSQKGDRTERGLSNWLEDDHGWYAQRTGASGGGTDRERPDIIAARDGRIYLIEVKAWADATGHLGRKEVEDLREAADRAGGTPLIAVKPDLRSHDQWHIFDAFLLHETPGGNFSVRKDDLPGMAREEVFE